MTKRKWNAKRLWLSEPPGGDKTRAKAAYADFLTLWKNADRDIPVFKEANAEYEKLR
jgi:hypothetical protein